MQLEPSLLSQLEADLVAINFSEENARIAMLESSIVTTRDTLERTLARQQEILSMLRPMRAEGGPTNAISFAPEYGHAVATALLSGASTTDAAALSTTEEELERERQALEAAIPVLRRKIEDQERAIKETKAEARKRLLPILQPVLDALTGQAQAAAESIRDIWAALEILTDLTNAFSPGLQSVRIAVKGFYLDLGLLKRGGPVETPSALADAMLALGLKGPALPPRSIRSRVDPLAIP